MDEPLFYLDNVSFGYGAGEPVFRDVSLQIRAGEKICVLGANGSGKSTLLKILCALIFPGHGSFRFFGQEITEQRMEDDGLARDYHRRIGFIFQNSDVQLFNASVWDEIAYGPLQMGLSGEQVRQRVADVLAMLQIENLRERSPHRLSGGEKKKVAVASVLALNPEVLILDEPTSGLDPKTERWLTDLLLELNRNGRTIIASTHNLDLAHVISTRSLVLSEAHRLVCDDSTHNVLANRELLMDVNLIDEYCHFHGDHEHIHRYTHG
ncbi:MAG: transporter related protein [Firmicutes bacterium]|nr:transporter related protein [Bacillota bacterium]